MNFKSLLFGSAAVLAAGTGAQAADLPVVEPVEYVRICDAFGTGFYYIPGTETCLRVSGRVRVEAHYVDGEPDDFDTGLFEPDFNNWTTRARGNVRLDARTQTDFGLVRAFINMQGTIGPTDVGNYGDGFALDQAFIQISRERGTFTAGHVDSFFDAPFSSNTFGSRVFIDDPTGSNTLFGYTFSFGGPLSVSVSIEDPLSGGHARADGDEDYEGQEFPDGVANVRYDAGWGTLFAAGAIRHIHDNDQNPPDPNGESNGLGWAVNGGFNGSFGMFTAGLTAGYSEGAIRYITNDVGGLGDFDGPDADDTNTAWAVRGGIGANFTPTIGAFLDASYTHVEEADDFDEYDYWAVAANVVWSPVEGLVMGPEVAFANLDLDDGGGLIDEGGSRDGDIWGVMFRIQRDF